MSNYADPNNKELFVISIHAAMAMLFVFLPFWIMIKSELDDFRSNRIAEHTSGRSIFGFFMSAIIIVSFANMVYLILISVLEVMFPNYNPIVGADGVTRLFWTLELINADETIANFEGELKENSLKVFYHRTIEYLRMAYEMLSVVIVLTLLLLSVKLSWSMIGNYQDDSQKTSLISTILKIFISFTIAGIILNFYSEATSWIINYPNDNTIWSVAADWFIEAIENNSQQQSSEFSNQ
jgi:hypothetical protein